MLREKRQSPKQSEMVVTRQNNSCNIWTRQLPSVLLFVPAVSPPPPASTLASDHVTTCDACQCICPSTLWSGFAGPHGLHSTSIFHPRYKMEHCDQTFCGQISIIKVPVVKVCVIKVCVIKVYVIKVCVIKVCVIKVSVIKVYVIKACVIKVCVIKVCVIKVSVIKVYVIKACVIKVSVVSGFWETNLDTAMSFNELKW